MATNHSGILASQAVVSRLLQTFGIACNFSLCHSSLYASLGHNIPNVNFNMLKVFPQSFTTYSFVNFSQDILHVIEIKAPYKVVRSCARMGCRQLMCILPPYAIISLLHFVFWNFAHLKVFFIGSAELGCFEVNHLQSDYHRKLSLKLLSIEYRPQNPMPNSLQSNNRGSSNGPPDPGSFMQNQVYNQGQSPSIPLSANQSQGQQQLLSQNIQNDMSSAEVQGSSGLLSAPPLPLLGTYTNTYCF